MALNGEIDQSQKKIEGNEKGTTFDKKFNVYPLPSSEILANPKLTQIDGYNEVQN